LIWTADILIASFCPGQRTEKTVPGLSGGMRALSFGETFLCIRASLVLYIGNDEGTNIRSSAFLETEL
jgi:hypothetical protein